MTTGKPVDGHLSTAKILLIGEVCSDEKGIRKVLSEAGYRCRYTADIHIAARLVQSEKIVDILLVSSGIVGDSALEAVREMAEGYLPVIVLVEDPDEVETSVCKKLGVDGFLRCPVNPKLLELTVDSALRLRRLYRYQMSQRKQLLGYRQHIDLEREVAAKIYSNVLQNQFLETGVVNAVISPTSLFKGDLLLVERTPDDHLYVLLGDFTGHGLSASVAAVPVAEVFYGMAGKGFALVDIVREINAKLYKMLPVDRFMAATALALYPDSKTLSLITCGLPEHLLVDVLTGGARKIKSKNIPLGIDRSLHLVEQNFSVSNHHRLYLLTDEVFEVANEEGEAFGYQRVVDALLKQVPCGFEVLQAELAVHSKNRNNDTTFAELICDVESVPWKSGEAVRLTNHVQAFNWRTAMEFNIDALRLINPVPVVVNALMEIQGLHQHRQAIFLIIGELFANALDHGVLGLDSAIKMTPEGFMRFYELKEQRIQSLQRGKIRLSFVHRPTEKGGRLTIKVVDSGEGFNWHQRLMVLEENLAFSGRGLKLLESLCSQLTFHGKGNRVTAVFDWRN